MAGAFDVQAQGLRELTRDLKKLAPETLKEFRKEVRVAVKPAVQELKAEIGRMPRVPSELASAMQRALTIEVPSTAKRAGVFVKLKRSKLPRQYQATAGNINRRGQWRHPVFGNRRVFVVQKSTVGFFDTSFQDDYPHIQRAVERAMTQAARKADLI